MSKFKVGDKVRITRTDYVDNNYQVGKQHLVAGVDSLGADLGSKPLYFYDEELELVTDQALAMSKTTVLVTYGDNDVSMLYEITNESFPGSGCGGLSRSIEVHYSPYSGFPNNLKGKRALSLENYDGRLLIKMKGVEFEINICDLQILKAAIDEFETDDEIKYIRFKRAP